jgi:peroxiredoxin
MDAVTVAAFVLPWLLCAVLVWLVYALIRQHGRALLKNDELAARLGALEQTIAALPRQPQQQTAPQGLPAGTPAPRFELPDLHGVQRRLEDYLGQPLLLIFWSPSCGFCEQMAPELRRLPQDAPRVLLVSSGDADANKEMVEQHGWEFDVLLQNEGTVSADYQSPGTPTGYLVDAAGNIARPLAVGNQALLEIIRNGNAEGNGFRHAHGTVESALAAGLRARGVSESRINRNGLPAGTAAPHFELPDLAGQMHSLDEYRGKRLLLVFSDPSCGPCRALMPKLEKVHRRRVGNDVDVVMISRGAVEENRAKAAEEGVTFNVLVQRSWEMSKAYGRFETPVAYLIDANGVIEADAVGAEAILALANSETLAAKLPN